MLRYTKKAVLVTSFVFISTFTGCFFDEEEEYYTDQSVNDNGTISKEIKPAYNDKIFEHLTRK